MTDSTVPAAQSADLDLFMRLDALVGQLMGGLENLITGEGGSTDRVNGWVPRATGAMTDQWLVQSYAGIPWARLICEKPARWLQQAGIRVEQADGLPDVPPEKAKPGEGRKKKRKPRPRGPADVLALDEAYGLTSSIGRSYGWARMLGGAAVVIDVVGDDDWSKPWVPKKGQEVRLHPYDGISIQPVQRTQGGIREEGLPDIWQRFQRHDRPRFYRILQTAYTDGSRRDVHWTRVMPLLGMELPPGGVWALNSGYRTWPALSVIEHCWQQIRAYGAMDAGIERIMAVLAIWVMILPSLPGLQSGPSAGTPGTGANAAAQTGVAALLASIVNNMRAGGTFVGPNGSQVTPASLSLAGIGDIDARTKGSLSAASDCPQFVIFGEDKGGLAAGSANAMPTSLRVWTTNLSGWWDDQWAWNIRRFLTGACVVQWGAAPTELRVKVGAFIPTTEAEEMAIRKNAADEAAALVREGIWAKAEAHRRYEGGFTVDFQIDPPEETEEDVGAEGGSSTASATPSAQGAEAVADLALNGAQTESLVNVLTEGGAKRLTPEGKMLVIRASFPAIKEETARAMAAQLVDVETPTPGDAPSPIPDTRGDADFGGTAYLYLDLGAEGIAAWRELQVAASAIVPLEGYDPGDAAPTEPHVTLLYLGAVKTRDQKAALAAATGILAGERLPQLRPVGVTLFGEDGRRPVVVELASAGVKRLHNALLRALAPWVAEVQHPVYRAHVTLGFATPTPEQVATLEDLPVPATLGQAAAACCTWDGSRVLALPTRP